MQIYTVGNLFSGIGGVCLGFKNAGFKISWANEWDKQACITYRENFTHRLIEEDIHKINKASHDLGYVDVLTSGFPCQAFSVAGYQKGFEDSRGNLFFETARLIDEIKPKAYFLENVKNLDSHDGGKTFQVIKETITKELGYSFIPFILNPKDYGNVPHTRERIYIVGFRDATPYQEFIEKYSLELFHNSDYLKTKSYHFKKPTPIKLSKNISTIIEKEKVDDAFYYGKDSQYYPKLKESMKNHKTVYQWRGTYVRENKSNVCPTLTANMGTGGHNVPLIIDDYGYRKLTPRECLRFQGFPDNFKLPKNQARSHSYKQAGNSVTVPVIERIAKGISDALSLEGIKGSKAKLNLVSFGS